MYIATKEEVVEGPDGCICTCHCHCTCSLDTASMVAVMNDVAVSGGLVGALITHG